jgi:hypothetical protein
VNVNPLEQYKVIEAERVIAIVPQNGVVPGANNLIIADMATCCEYLSRYTEHRINGKDIKEAHELALRGAQIVRLS